MSDYIRRKQRRWHEERQREADEEAKRKAEREAQLAAEARKRKEDAERKQLLREQQESDRLRQMRIQEKKELDDERMSKQVDTLISKLEADQRLRENVRLQEIQIIIQNREPYFGVLDWRTWLSNPNNQRLAELDFELAVQMFRRENRMGSLRQGTGGKRRRQEFNYALSFSGDRAGATDSYATTTFNPDTYELWNGFTISFWVRPDEAMNQTSVILGSKSNSPSEARFKFGVHSNGNINVGIGNSNVTGINNPMEVGQWYNWVLTYTGDDKGVGERKVRMWINNDPRMTSNTNTRWANQDEDQTIYFGGRNTEGAYTQGFACALTNVAIYNVCKDSDGTFANEVYNNGINANYEGSDDLVGYWRFSEGEGITIADTSGNGNNGTFGAIAGQTTAYPIWEKIK